MSFMDFFRAPGMSEYKAMARLNDGVVALLFEIRRGKKTKAGRMVLLTRGPRSYTIKVNELKRVLNTFQSTFPDQNADCYCRFSPIKEKFILSEDFITLASSGERISIKKVPYYDGLLARNKN